MKTRADPVVREVQMEVADPESATEPPTCIVGASEDSRFSDAAQMRKRQLSAVVKRGGHAIAAKCAIRVAKRTRRTKPTHL